jgi:hypothetical protein
VYGARVLQPPEYSTNRSARAGSYRRIYILDFGLAKLHELDALDVQTEVTIIRQVAARWDTSSQFYETFFVGWHIEFAVCLLQASA